MFEEMIKELFYGKVVEAHGEKWIIIRHLKGNEEKGVFEAVRENANLPALVHVIMTGIDSKVEDKQDVNSK